MKKVLVVLFAALFAAGCGGGSNKFAIKYKGKDVKFEKTVGLADFRPDLVEGQIVIANYEPKHDGESVMTIENTEKAGETFVYITFKANNTENYKDCVKPGDVSDNIRNVYITNGDTKDQVSFRQDGKVPGKLVITEVTADTIKGTIDLKKDDTTVSGPFEAKILAKTP